MNEDAATCALEHTCLESECDDSIPHILSPKSTTDEVVDCRWLEGPTVNWHPSVYFDLNASCSVVNSTSEKH